MINWFDMPAEGLSNGGEFEVKELEVTENGTYEEKGEMYNKVIVNVEGGGGGSSDFSTAEVTVVNNLPDGDTAFIFGAFIVDDALVRRADYERGTSTKECVLYRKNTSVNYPTAYKNVSVSGNAELVNNGVFIAGDCTITIS